MKKVSQLCLNFPLVPEHPAQGSVWVWRSGATNLGYLICPGEGRKAIAIDVPNGTEMTNLLKAKGLELGTLLLTHTHHDHVNGLVELVQESGCDFYSAVPFADLPRKHVTDGMSWTVEGREVLAWVNGGHSDSDTTFLFPDVDLCFCGDTLFAWGCGRMFTGPAERLWGSLARLRSLPDETRICCGHDFRKENREFLTSELSAWKGAAEAVSTLDDDLREHPVFHPWHLGPQKQTNPFLRADDPDLAKAVGKTGATPDEVFAELRNRRNAY